MSCLQWRVRMAGWRSSDTSGSDVSIAFTASSSFLSNKRSEHTACACVAGVYAMGQ